MTSNQFISYCQIRQVNINIIIAIIFITSSIGNFIPYSMGQHYSLESDDDIVTPLDVRLKSSALVKISLSASIFSMIPFLMDLFLDFISKPSSQQQNMAPIPSNNYKEALIFPRTMLLLLVIPDIYMLSIGIPFDHFDFIHALLPARDTLLTYYFLSSLINLCSPIWNTWCYILIGFPIAFGNLLINVQLYTTDEDQLNAIYYLQQVVIAISLSFSLFCSVRWYKANHSSLARQESLFILCFTNIINFNIYLLANWLVIYPPTIPCDWACVLGESYLTLYTFILTLCVSGNYLVYSRYLRIEFQRSKANLEAKKVFIRTISHELRTPLNSVSIGLDILKMDNPSRVIGEYQEHINELKASLHDALEILNELLIYDKIENGALVIESAKFSVLSLFKAITAFSLQTVVRQISFKHNLDSQEKTFAEYKILGDEHKLKQVVRNVMSNAIKFTPNGGTVSVEAQLFTSQPRRDSKASPHRSDLDEDFDSIRIKVIDTGAGISKENQKKLFNSIVQFNAGTLQAGGGSGLGLVISRTILDAHYGSISVASEGEGRGSTFEIVLRCFRVSANDATRSSEFVESQRDRVDIASLSVSLNEDSPATKESSSAAVAGSAIADGLRELDSKRLATDEESDRVLIVDDSAVNRKMTKRLVQSRFNGCLEAENGVEAVRQVERYNAKISAVIIDNQMPLMDGVTAVKLMRERARFAGRIVIVTGDVMQDSRQSLVDCGADFVLYKPINPQELFACLN